MKLTINETKFFVNEEKKSVTCVIYGVLLQSDGNFMTPDFKIPVSTNSLDRDVWEDPNVIGNCNFFRVSSTTRCTENDVFDVRIGKKIAKQKARIKMYKEAAKVCLSAYLISVNELGNAVEKFNFLLNSETLDYEKNVLEIKLPETVKLTDEDGKTTEYELFEDSDRVGYVNGEKDDFLDFAPSRMELLDKLNEMDNVWFEGK